MRGSLALLPTLTLLLLGCPPRNLAESADPKAVKEIADAFHRRARWKDFEGASNLLVGSKRAAFLEARERVRDDRDLQISDYELLELVVDPDGQTATVRSRISWLRLPSLSERVDIVVTELIPLDSRNWLITRQTKGPFGEELGEPYVPDTQP